MSIMLRLQPRHSGQLSLSLKVSQRQSRHFHQTKWQFESEPTHTARDRSLDYKLRGKGRNFVDFVRVVARGGTGGDGCVSFHREKYVAKGPPNGGNGGRGGSVIFTASADETTLNHIPYLCAAKRGGPGLGASRHGLSGQDLIVKVPLGTIIREVDAPASAQARLDELSSEETKEEKLKKKWVHYPRSEQTTLAKGDFFRDAQKLIEEEERYARWKERQESESQIYIDMDVPDQSIVAAKGGVGGYGNPHFVTTENRSPKFATRGYDGKTRYLELELKTIADAGLVGLPNAGKSTFLSAVSNAHPKIAPYPFTTLNPYIGTVDFVDSFQLTVADIPGLIKGAHKNIGLGHAFLRHIERSKVLVYVIDLSVKEPWNDFSTLCNELEAYSKGLTKRPSIVIANKADVTAVAKDNFKKFEQIVLGEFESKGEKVAVIPVSAKYKKNIVKATTILRNMVEQEQSGAKPGIAI
ncbi:hypothetical protein INT43_003812 [Umbelopsis isabellina]|uniref:Uncharacterized protein n=1 Tax=Mortierella isabellina TaxID=91625 RepID=A0A8H7PUA3_MORIS|nr:hypothetical protein INT43_003812 [Umbelopsis isabellina]